MAQYLRQKWEVPVERLVLEEESRTTKENAENVMRIIERMRKTCFPVWPAKIGVLTLLYHMKKALSIFRKTISFAFLKPIFAEVVLAEDPNF